MRVEMKPSPYGGAVEAFQCLFCRAITARVAARMPNYRLPVLRNKTDQIPDFYRDSHDHS